MAAYIPAGPSVPAAISPGTVEKAVLLARDYYLPHAKAAFSLMGADKRTADGRRVAERLKSPAFREHLVQIEGRPWRVRRRTIHALILGSRHTPEDVDAVVDLLARQFYLRPWGEESKRGRPGTLFEVNPELFREEAGQTVEAADFCEQCEPLSGSEAEKSA